MMSGYVFKTDNAFDWGYRNNTNAPFDLILDIQSHPYAYRNGCSLHLSTSDGRYNLIINGGDAQDIDAQGNHVGKRRVVILTLLPGVRVLVLERWDGPRSAFSLSVFLKDC
ncbi:hypothetical protein [Helicobacter heilmannii]|uniref:hypothetical protein n=1 Tax=Helicobacter heilmannii TaxID=35817 RepID=UPI000CF06DB5|nr:hypothetical protein [Helicobacter heilmannii]